MPNSPETSESLIEQVKDPANSVAWAEFVTLYEPVILRMALRRDLQEADARDVCQKVLLAVSQAIGKWQPRADLPFRAWLGRISRNAILNAVCRRPRDEATGLSAVELLLNNIVDTNDQDSSELILETRRQLFQKAIAVVQCEFTKVTWELFWQTEIEGRPVETVAEACGKTTGAVYIARCRIMKRLRELVQNESQTWGVDS